MKSKIQLHKNSCGFFWAITFDREGEIDGKHLKKTKSISVKGQNISLHEKM